MAMSCPEVMYGAYYPYLYGRGARYHHPHFQYDRLNAHGSGAAEYGGGGGGGSSPGSPPGARRTKQELGRTSAEPEPEPNHARAHYLSANCVVFTHYAGDVAASVDEHFARALAHDKHKESVPLASRNLPASFFNAAATSTGGAGGVGGAAATSSCAAGVELYEYEAWGAHYGTYSPHAGGWLLPRHVPQYKPVDWPHHHVDPAHCHSYSYPGVAGRGVVAGLEAPVQDSSKDLYWF